MYNLRYTLQKRAVALFCPSYNASNFCTIHLNNATKSRVCSCNEYVFNVKKFIGHNASTVSSLTGSIGPELSTYSSFTIKFLNSLTSRLFLPKTFLNAVFASAVIRSYIPPFHGDNGVVSFHCKPYKLSLL